MLWLYALAENLYALAVNIYALAAAPGENLYAVSCMLLLIVK